MRIIFGDKYRKIIKKLLSVGIILLLVMSALTICNQKSVLSFTNLIPPKNMQTSKLIKNPKPNSDKIKTTIPIAMATDNNYLDITLVSILSAIKNADKNTILKFYIMVTNDFSENNKQKVQKIIDTFENCNIELIDMGNSFKEFYLGHWGPATYYKLKLSSILKNENKCIYLDGDTLVLEDLKDMYNLDLNEYYVSGVYDFHRRDHEYGKRLGISDMENYVCSGVLLWNLAKIREDNIENKFLQFLQNANKNGTQLFCPDQDIINLICYGKILPLPFKYGALEKIIDRKRYVGDYYLMKILSKKEWLEAKNNPVIIHFAGEQKPWNTKTRFSDLWQKYYDNLTNVLSSKEGDRQT